MTPTVRRALVPVLVLALTACGGGGGEEKAAEEPAEGAAAACATPTPTAPTTAPTTAPAATAAAAPVGLPRPVPKRDSREIDGLTPEQVDLVTRLAEAEAALAGGTVAAQAGTAPVVVALDADATACDPADDPADEPADEPAGADH